MDILKSNNGKEVQYIINSHVYLRVWDYGKKQLLVHLSVPNIHFPNLKVWSWLDLNEGSITDVMEHSHKTFEDAINKAVNNPYCTTYQFDTYASMAKSWDDIKYVDTITTTYKGEEK